MGNLLDTPLGSLGMGEEAPRGGGRGGRGRRAPPQQGAAGRIQPIPSAAAVGPNMYKLLRKSALTGVPLTPSTLPAGSIRKMNSQTDGAVQLMRALAYEAYDARTLNLEVQRLLTKLYELLADTKHRHYDVRVDTIVRCDGARILMTIIRRLQHADSVPLDGSQTRMGQLNIANHAMQVLRGLCFGRHYLTRRLVGNDAFIIVLFGYLREAHTFDAAIHLLEEILAQRRDTFNLAQVPNFEELIMSFASRKLACFCRILALLVFEPEHSDPTKPLSAEAVLEISARLSRRLANLDRNHALVLGHPELLRRLVRLAAVPIPDHPGQSFMFTFGNDHPEEADQDVPVLNLQHLIMAAYATHPEAMESVLASLQALLQPVTHSDWAAPSAEDLMHVFSSAEPANDWSTIRCVAPGDIPDESLADRRRRGDMGRLMDGAINFPPPPRSAAHAGASAVSATAIRSMTGGSGIFPADCIFDERDLIGTVPPPRAATRVEVRHTAASRSTGRSTGPRASPSADSDPLDQLMVMSLSAYQVEIIFVLCGLLNGRRRLQLQDEFVKLGLHKVLFEHLNTADWTPPPPRRHMPRPHGPGCNCTPESALKIQVLRLIHMMMDRVTRDSWEMWSSRRWFLSDEERHLIETNDDRILSAGARTQGLVRKMVSLLMHSPPKSPYRFWFCSGIEAFLRGAPPIARRWLCSLGLLEHTCEFVLERGARKEARELARRNGAAAGDGKQSERRRRRGHGHSHSHGHGHGHGGHHGHGYHGDDDYDDAGFDDDPEHFDPHRAHHEHEDNHGHDHNHDDDDDDDGSDFDDSASDSSEHRAANGSSPLQSAFDVLGELVKFNLSAFRRFDSRLTAPQFKEFMRIACMNLIDSNVFLRTVILNIALCGREADAPTKASPLWQFVQRNLPVLLHCMMGTMRPVDVNQENICCLNTALCCFVLAQERGALAALVESVQRVAANPLNAKLVFDDDQAGAEQIWCDPPQASLGMDALSNFVDLLNLWDRYYSSRGRDRAGLESSSGISFDVWYQTAKLLRTNSAVGLQRHSEQ